MLAQKEKVVQFNDFKAKKEEKEKLCHRNKPLYLSYSKASANRGGNDLEQQNLSDFSDKIASLKASIDKVNGLLSDLKRIPNSHI